MMKLIFTPTSPDPGQLPEGEGDGERGQTDGQVNRQGDEQTETGRDAEAMHPMT